MDGQPGPATHDNLRIQDARTANLLLLTSLAFLPCAMTVSEAAE